MATWVSIFERQPKIHGNYFVKVDGDKKLLHISEFDRAMGGCETFLWLDEFEEQKKNVAALLAIDNIDDFCKTDYRIIAENVVVPYSPYIPKSVVTRTFHKYYLRIIGKLRGEIGVLNRQIDRLKQGGCFISEPVKESPELNKINELINSNSFF